MVLCAPLESLKILCKLKKTNQNNGFGTFLVPDIFLNAFDMPAPSTLCAPGLAECVLLCALAKNEAWF